MANCVLFALIVWTTVIHQNVAQDAVCDVVASESAHEHFSSHTYFYECSDFGWEWSDCSMTEQYRSSTMYQTLLGYVSQFACCTGYSQVHETGRCEGTSECLESGTCEQHMCNNIVVTFSCSCNSRLIMSGYICNDIQECASGNGGCSQVSLNIDGSFICDRFTVSCEDNNECSSNGGKGPCAQICTNTAGSFTCSCNTGYVLSGYACNDINECTLGTSGCNQNCTNSNGSYVCSCYLGYQISSNNRTCVEIIPSMNIQVTPVLNPNNTLRHLEISWIPVDNNVTTYTVRVVGSDNSVGQGYTVCTTSPCLYVHHVTQEANNYSIFVTPINRDETLGSQDSTAIYGPTNTIFYNVSFLSYNNSIACSFLNNQSFYCMVCCSTDPSVPPVSSVYNISSTRSTEATVSLQGLTSGQMYYCMIAATSTNSAYCTGPVNGDVKMYFNFVTSLLPITSPTTSNMSTLVAAIDTYVVIGITIGTSFVVFFSLGVMVSSCICCVVKKRSKVTLHHSPMAPSVYEMTGKDQKVAAFEVETNSAYGIAAQQSESIYMHVE